VLRVSEASKHKPQAMIHVATIIAAHGIKGEVKIKSFTADPKAFATYGPLSSKDGRVFEIKAIRPQKDEFLCTLSNVTDRNAAEALRGVELYVARDRLPTLAEREFYLSDLQGKQAVADGKSLGRITGFQNFGAGELMELDGGTLVPISFIGAVTDVVSLNLPVGYLDDEKQDQ
jgi:16S rRNA processing protein RimM